MVGDNTLPAAGRFKTHGISLLRVCSVSTRHVQKQSKDATAFLQSPAYRFSDSEDCYILLMLLWSPYGPGIGQTIIFSCCSLFFVLSSSFPRLISAAADWMSAILPHMVWP